MIPCISKKSIKLLSGTSDERYNFSKDFFRSTHYPQTLHQYYKNKLIDEVKEEELLQELCDVDANGNRIFVVFGSTGSGKSELLCWIRDQWIERNISRPVIRISRSELNPQLLIKKCYELTGLSLETKVDEDRWNILLQKPVTLINQLVWSTLSEFFETDEEIIPIAMLLRPVIENNITSFSEQVQRGNINTPLEVLNISQFEEVVKSTTIQIKINFPSFRQSLLKKLDHFIFDGKDILTLMKELSYKLLENNIRPLLLIDDLVQSVNIYASELLDHMISLEEGNWDVVIGITPGSLHESKNNELTERIYNLDTIDDRIKKLWLSDEKGYVFHTLDKGQAISYIERYLNALKLSEGFTCSLRCPHSKECEKLLVYQDSEISLLPFNKFFVERIYDGVAEGKGKLRYMILHTKEILRLLYKNNDRSFSKIQSYVKRNRFAHSQNILLKTLAETYVDNENNNVKLPEKLLNNFDLPLEDNVLQVTNVDDSSEINYSMVNITDDNKEVKTHVRDWIEGKKVNEQLLQPVRMGISSIIQDVCKGTSVTRRFTARSSSTIQRKEVFNGVRFPITFKQSNNMRKETLIYPDIFLLSVSNHQELKTNQRGNNFNNFSNEQALADWIYEGEGYKEQWLKELETELDMPLMKFVYFIKEWSEKIEKVSIGELGSMAPSPITNEVKVIIDSLYEDWFCLRDNLIDRSALNKFQFDKFDIEEWIIGYKSTNLLRKFIILQEIDFDQFIRALQKNLAKYINQLEGPMLREIDKISRVTLLVNDIPEKANEKASKLFRRDIQYSFTTKLVLLEDICMCYKDNSVFDLYDDLTKKCQDEYEWYLNYVDRCKTISLTLGIETNLHDYSYEDIQMKIFKSDFNSYKQKLTIIDQIEELLNIIPLEILVGLRNQDTTLYECETRIFTLWTRLVSCFKMLVSQEDLDVSIKKIIDKFKKLNFLYIHNIWNQKLLIKEKVEELLEIIVKERGWKIEEINANNVLYELKNDKEIRPHVKKHIAQILLKGSTTVSQNRWKGLINDLQKECPELFSHFQFELHIQ